MFQITEWMCIDEEECGWGDFLAKIEEKDMEPEKRVKKFEKILKQRKMTLKQIKDEGDLLKRSELENLCQEWAEDSPYDRNSYIFFNCRTGAMLEFHTVRHVSVLGPLQK